MVLYFLCFLDVDIFVVLFQDVADFCEKFFPGLHGVVSVFFADGPGFFELRLPLAHVNKAFNIVDLESEGLSFFFLAHELLQHTVGLLDFVLQD